jgi:uncharacterized protein with ParB-like and HNH nuclease domain
MKANELPINSFLQAPNVQFVIPVYQRNYDWRIEECKELVNDIISVEQENRGTHFIGSIVFIHEGTYSTSEVKELVIIDGQQRLTTINILYVALYRYAKEQGLEQEANMLYNMFLTNQYVQNEDSKLKLKQTDNNSNAFKAIMLGTEREFGSYSNVIENYNFFRSVINTESFLHILNGLKRLIFVEISLERDKDDPQRIFESLNSTGLDLSQSDLIRNFILMDLDPKDQNRIFEQIWNPIEENAKDLVKQKSMVSEYIRDYLTLKNKKIPNKNSVYIEFKKLYNNKKDEVYHQELENIKSLSIHYKKLINPQSVADVNLKRELEYIARLEINVAYPFLLQVFEDADNGLIDAPTLLKILKLVQSFTWRRFIVGLPTNALNRIFMVLYSEIDLDDYYNSLAIALMKKKGSSKFPTNEDLNSALKDKDLYNTQSKNRNYLFELLENHNNREYVDTSSSLITIEHIYPQNPSEKWHNELSGEELNIFKEKKLNTIANLTLSGNNGLLSNKSFQEKKDMNKDGGEQGYKFSRLWLNVYLNQIDNWNLDNYEERFGIIYNRFLDIWQYPDIEIPLEEDTSEFNITDIEDTSNRKLEYFIFEDTKVEEEAVSKMFYFILKKLYDKNPQLLLNNEGILKITRSSNEFTESLEIFNGYFIDPRANNNRKFRVLKDLLNLFELEDELTVKFVQNESKVKSRFEIRKSFWKQLLDQLPATKLFNNVRPTKDHWLSTGAGISGISYTLLITRAYVGIELTISRASKQENKHYFKCFKEHKEEIEKALGKELIWEELPDNKMSKIKIQLNDVNIFDEEDWPKMTAYFIDNLNLFESSISPVINKYKNRSILI